MCSSSKCLATTTAALLGTLQYNQSIWKCDFGTNESRGVNPGGLEGSQPPGFAQGGSWTGREILLYLIMYRKYVRKWWLLKKNRIICP